MNTLGDRIRVARIAKGLTQGDIAKHFGIKRPSVTQWELNSSSPARDKIRELARLLCVNSEWLLSGDGEGPTADTPSREAVKIIDSNAQFVSNVNFTNRLIPIFGKAVGGPDGEFLFNGEVMAHVNCPPILAEVENPYAVYVAGDSMEPRYFEGEVVYVDPERNAVRGDFVIAQIYIDKNSPPHAFVKRLVKYTTEELVLEQLNPAKKLTFTGEQLNELKLHVVVASSLQ